MYVRTLYPISPASIIREVKRYAIVDLGLSFWFLILKMILAIALLSFLPLKCWVSYCQPNLQDRTNRFLMGF